MVDRGQLVSCSRFIDGEFFFTCIAPFTFHLVHCGSLVSSYTGVAKWNRVSGGITVVPTPKCRVS